MSLTVIILVTIVIVLLGVLFVIMVTNLPLQCEVCSQRIGDYFMVCGQKVYCEKCAPFPRKLYPPRFPE